MSKTIGERELVLAILLEVTRDKIPAHLALSRVLGKYQYLDKRERAFITKVTEGTLEHMIEIDYIIDQFSKIKIQKMKPVVLAILRSGVYQLRYLDHVPASAVCNEAVKLAKKKGLSMETVTNGDYRSYRGQQYDKLADILRASLDMDAVYGIMGLPPRGRN